VIGTIYKSNFYDLFIGGRNTMSPRSSDLYLNALCLAAYAPGAPTIKIAAAVVGMFDDLSKDERTMLSPLNILYVKLLRDIAVGNLDLSNRAEASSVLLKYQDDKAFENNRVSFKELQALLFPEALPAPQKIRVLFNRVKNNLIFFKTNSRIRKMMLTAQRVGSEDDIEKQNALFKEILASAETMRNEIEDDPTGQSDDLIPIDEIDFCKPNTILKALTHQHKKREGEMIHFGWQGLNRMMGPKRAAAYGESFAFAGASHCGKSLILQSMALSHCLYNKPPDTGGLTPVILFISLENEVSENLVQLYKTLFVNVYHKEPDGLKDQEVVELLSNKLSEQGFHFIIIRRLGESFGYSEYAQYYDNMLRNGCKIVATYLDYITLCKREAVQDQRSGPNDAKQIEIMVERFKDHSARNNVFFCTAFQLDAEAARIKQAGQANPVRKFTEATLADCKGALRPLDGLFFNDIENNHQGTSYLCFAWRKHRYVHDTDKDDKYFAMKFGPLGLPFDFGSAPTFVRDIYSDNTEDPEEQQVSVF
jgi:hypothetical protein